MPMTDHQRTERSPGQPEGRSVEHHRGAADPAGLVPGVAPGFLARLGLAIRQPRWALTVAADRRHAGRSGSDLIAAIAVGVLATQLRGLASAVWLGSAVEV